MKRFLRSTALHGAILTLLCCAACGLPPAGHSETIGPSDVPFGLLKPSPAESAIPDVAGPPRQIYFVHADRLVAATRRVVGVNVPAEVLRLLLDGPTRQEAARRNLITDIPEGTRLMSLDVTDSVATVDLSKQFGAVGGSDQVLAVAQIVYTVTASGRIRAVQFAIDGKPIEVPDGSGSLAKTPRSRTDYRQVAPP